MSGSAAKAQAPVWRAAGMPSLLVATAAGFSGYAALFPVSPLWAVRGGADEAGSGLVNGVLLFVTVLTQILVPRLLRRFGVALVLGAGLALLGVPSLLQLISNTLGWVLVLAGVRGIGFGILTVCGAAAVAHLVTPARHGAAIGAYGAAIAVPQVLLLPLGPWLADSVGFWLVFALGTLPVLGIGFTPRLARAWRVHDSDGAQRPSDADATKAFADDGPRRKWIPAGLLRPMFLLFGATLAGGALITFAPQMVSAAAATTGGLALLTITAAITRWGIGGLADRYGTRPFLWPLVVLTIVALALAAYAVADPGATRVFLFLIAMALAGIAYGGLQNLTLLLSLTSVRREDYDTASAAWNIGFDVGSGVGSVLVGSLAASFAFPPALLVAAVISLATLPLAFARGRRAH
ncbi:MAG: MFS transporter [Lacisediminihabitans sp.]